MNTAINTDPHQNSKNLYKQLLITLLQEYNVKSITYFCETKEHFFDKIENNGDGTITVWRYDGLKFSNLLFDYTCDYARCLSYIEDAIYCQTRNIHPGNYHGMIIEFKI